MAAALLNDVSSHGYIKFDALEIGEKYKVHKLGTYKSTAFGKERLCIKVYIDDGYLILPERWDEKTKDLKKLDIEKLYIIYNGREKGDYGCLQIKFWEEGDEEDEDESEEEEDKEDDEVEEQPPQKAPNKKSLKKTSPKKTPPKKAPPKKTPKQEDEDVPKKKKRNT